MNDLCPHGLPKNSPNTSEPSPRKNMEHGKLDSKMEPLVLTIRNMGPVPSKKNGKQISKNQKTGKLFLRTDDEKKKWCDQAIRLLESQLNSAYRTSVAMGTTASQRFWMSSFLPSNDSAKHIKKGSFEIVQVPKGQEGAVIAITNLANEISGVEAARLYSQALQEVKDGK